MGFIDCVYLLLYVETSEIYPLLALSADAIAVDTHKLPPLPPPLLLLLLLLLVSLLSVFCHIIDHRSHCLPCSIELHSQLGYGVDEQTDVDRG